MMAGLSGVAMAWRSTQLYEALRRPSRNQALSPLAKLPEWTVWKSRSQVRSSRARSPQNLCGFSIDSLYSCL